MKCNCAECALIENYKGKTKKAGCVLLEMLHRMECIQTILEKGKINVSDFGSGIEPFKFAYIETKNPQRYPYTTDIKAEWVGVFINNTGTSDIMYRFDADATATEYFTLKVGEAIYIPAKVQRYISFFMFVGGKIEGYGVVK